jgi:hypothetical protein
MLKKVIPILLILLNIDLFAQDQLVTAPKYQRHDVYFAPEGHENANLVLDLPLIDLPYLNYSYKANDGSSNLALAYNNPGMNIGLGLSYSTYSAIHYGLKRAVQIENKYWHNAVLGLGVGAADLGLYFSPLGNQWLHNEFTKGVMAVNYIDGENAKNNFSNALTNVINVTDEELANLKNNNNPEFLRMQVAGIEGEYLLVDKLQRTNFFYRSNLPNLILYWFTAINNVNKLTNQTDINDFTNAKNRIKTLSDNEKTDISKRDYTGLEFAGWSHDLFNPNEKYNDRGIHSSGNGIARYISPEQFSKEEISYMRTQTQLHYLNCISPSMFGIKAITVKKDELGNAWRLNFATRHLFTSFGNDISTKVYYQTPNNNWIFTLHNYNNFNNTFIGLEAEIVDYILKFNKKELPLTLRAIAWTQPINNEFKTDKSQLGGLFSLKLQYPLTQLLRPYIDLEAKSKGWVAGNVFLGSNISVRLGLNVIFGGE